MNNNLNPTTVNQNLHEEKEDSLIKESNKNNMNDISDSEKMPPPQIINYDVKYKISDDFITTIRSFLKELPYSDVEPIFKTLEVNKNIMPIAGLNEIIRIIASFPYKNVAGLMTLLQNKELNNKWFTIITK